MQEWNTGKEPFTGYSKKQGSFHVFKPLLSSPPQAVHDRAVPREHEGNNSRPRGTTMYRGRPIGANRKASSCDRPSFIGQNLSIRPTPSAEHENYRPRSTVPMADYDPMTADRPDRPSERPSTRSPF
ncbi:unnamed protein product [Microthlaspi erraticum]|uniref:Uncharacterized protein n=1 Tax=Microthlaspi erraticum TaxID=1685480 RepID=A0A6D2IYZ8_9BRAS|nr:unnamed protein product [Microthlaspi erraticum]